MRLAIDAMGGDRGVGAPVDASLNILQSHPALEHIFLVGREHQLNECVSQHELAASCGDRVSVVHADVVVAMDAQPSKVVRQRESSSMLKAIEMLAHGDVDACVSSGNTGALVGLARHYCGLYSGVKRLAICTQLPTFSRPTYMLDVGGNVDCTAEQLFQFAQMGQALFKSLNGASEQCRIGALSIGREGGKGALAVKGAAELCAQEKDMRYVGMIEGDDLLFGTADVIFCDGFVGNVALKACEGTARYIQSIFNTTQSGDNGLASGSNDFSDGESENRISVVRDQPWDQRINPDQFNGAYLLGVRQMIVKAHGASNQIGFYAAIKKAVDAVSGNLQQRLAASF